MRPWLSLRRGVALAVLAAAVPFVASSALVVEPGCAGKAPAPAAPPPIVVGVSLGLTGGKSGTSQPVRDAVRVAEGDINAAGGVLGRQLVFDIEDDRSDEGSGIQALAQSFVAKGVVAVIGPIGSQQVLATQKIFADAHIIQIAPTATSTDLTTVQPSNDRWLFRTTPADDFQGAAVMLLAQRTPRGLGDGGAPPQVDGGPPSTCTKLALVNVDNSYGNAMGDIIEKFWPKRTGGPLLVRKKVPVQLAASYADVVASVFALGPECMAYIGYDDVAAQLVKDMKADKGYTALASKGFFLMGTDGTYTDQFLKESLANPADPTSANAAEGTYGTNPDTQSGSTEYNQFRTLFDSYFPLGGKDAPPFASNAYDAAILVALAIQQAGNVTDRTAVRNGLVTVATPPGRPYTPSQLVDALQAIQNGDDIDYKGASGNCDFDPNGNVKSNFIVWEAYKQADKTVGYRTDAHFALEDLVGELQ